MKNKHSTTPPELIPSAVVADIGRTLFGGVWQVQLAKALRVNDQAVRRWTNDGCPVALEKQLRALLEERAQEIHDALLTLNDYGDLER